MYYDTKNVLKLFALFAVISTSALIASDFITITTPTNGSTVSGSPLSVTGTSSQPNAQVEFLFDGVDIGSITTDESGNFSVSFASIPNGTYAITLSLLASDGTTVLATTTISFAIVNPATIFITTPSTGTEIFINPITVSGTASNPSTTVHISVDGSLVATTTTDDSGNWSSTFYLTSNGYHTILAELIASDSIVATNSISVLTTIIQRILKGYVPTIGSGSGPGYTYSNSGSITSITATTPFVFAPVAIATGKQSSGASTVTVVSVSNSGLDISYSLGTEGIYFLFAAFT
ncbi:hypothetical protein JST99_01620 [Candidatus Dependentiae bacterium]|nr:hypothetical protein [Candidatus Dependentiae bacterium]